MGVGRPPALAAWALALALVTGCTPEGSGEPETAASDTPTASAQPSTAGASPSEQEPEPTAQTPEEPTASPSPQRPPHPVSLPALFDQEYDGRRLRLGEVLIREDAYTQRAVTYRSDGLTISGVLNIPRRTSGNRRRPFPALVLAHGYIDPAIYVTGQGLRREQDWLARAGYVVLHVDYRNHAGSDEEPRAERRLRLGYTVDVINAVHALRRSGLRSVDPDRVGLLGRSMGGGVAYNVLTVAPGLVDAAVVYAPVSSRTEDNFERWIRGERPELAAAIIGRYGAPERSRRFWREVSPRTYFDRVTEPVLIHHGTADESCPIRWSRSTHRAMQRAGVDARLEIYPGEPHAFEAAWPRSMERTVRFFRRHLG